VGKVGRRGSNSLGRVGLNGSEAWEEEERGVVGAAGRRSFGKLIGTFCEESARAEETDATATGMVLEPAVEVILCL
jgi:hypothetical protein